MDDAEFQRMAKLHDDFVAFVSRALIDLHVRHHAMIETLEQYGVVPRERFATDVEAYRLKHADVLITQAREFLRRLQDGPPPNTSA